VSSTKGRSGVGASSWLGFATGCFAMYSGTHRNRRPHDGFDMHDVRQIRNAEFAEHPIKPLEIAATPPVRDADIDVAREPDAGVHCRAYDLRWQETVGTLPHQDEAGRGRRLEGEAIREVKVGVE
jgi:hypothetical protein